MRVERGAPAPLHLGTWWLAAVLVGQVTEPRGGWLTALAVGALAFLAGVQFVLPILPWAEAGVARPLALAAGLAALAAALQAAPAYLPPGAGSLALLSTLPVLLGGVLVPRGAAALVLAAAAGLFAVDVDGAWAFLLTQAPLGLAAAWAVAVRRPAWQRFLVPGAVLASGLLLRVHMSGRAFPAWPASGMDPPAEVLARAAFALGYAALWVALAGALHHRLHRGGAARGG